MKKDNYFNIDFNRRSTNSYKWDNPQFVGKDIIPFTIADSDYPTAPEIVKALMKRIEHGAFGYTFPGEDYFKIIQSWVMRRYHYRVEKEWIILSTGVLASLVYAILALSQEGDQIVIQEPVYNPFASIIKNNKRTLVINPLKCEDNYQIDFQHLEECFQKGAKMLLFCSPHNPVGRVWKEWEIDKLISLGRKYQITILSDEIHCDLILGNNIFYSLGHYFSSYPNLVVITAPSKTFNIAGLGIANIFVANPRFRDLIFTLRNKMHHSPNLLGVEACKAAYRDCEYWVDLQNQHLSAQFEFLKDFLKREIPEAKLTELEGTYLAWVDFRFLKMTSEELRTKLLEYQIAFNQGITYAEGCQGFIRINLACSHNQLQEGLSRLKNFVQAER